MSDNRDPALPYREVALDLFARQGYEKTRLRQITEALGVTKAALYYHYPSKEALLEAVVGPVLDDLDELLAKADPDRPERLLAAYLAFIVEHRDALSLVTQDLALRDLPDIRGRYDRQHARLREALRPTDDRVGELRASAAIGALWRPLVTLGAADDDTDHQVLLDAAHAALAA